MSCLIQYIESEHDGRAAQEAIAAAAGGHQREGGAAALPAGTRRRGRPADDPLPPRGAPGALDSIVNRNPDSSFKFASH